MRTPKASSGRVRPSGWGAALAALLVLLLAAPAASARSVNDPDIGWPTELRKELRLPKVSPKRCDAYGVTRAKLRIQNRIDRRAPGIRGRLYRIFHNREKNIWGNAWFLACDGGRMQVGVASGGSARDTRAAVRQARRYLERQKVSRDVRLVAVRSTYRELSDQVIALEPFEDRMLANDGGLSWGIDTQRNAVVIEGDHRVPESDRAVFREFARTSPVNVVVRFERAPDPKAPVPTYEARFELVRGSVDREGRTVTVRVDDPSCGATGAEDVAARFAGVRIRTLPHAYVLTARLRVNPEWGRQACADGPPAGSSAITTVTLPSNLGRRGIVDGADGPGGFRIIVVPPVGAAAIRSLVPKDTKYIYMDDTCDARDVRAAFRGRDKTEWCFF